MLILMTKRVKAAPLSEAEFFLEHPGFVCYITIWFLIHFLFLKLSLINPMSFHKKEKQNKLYNGEIVAGSLLVAESRGIAELLLKGEDPDSWREAVVTNNILQKRNPETARRQARLIKKRLLLMKPALWEMIVNAHADLATQAVMAAAIKHSRLLGDFMNNVIREHWRTFQKYISVSDWHHFMEICAQADPGVDNWSDSTRAKLKQVVFRILAEAGYIENTRSLVLQPVSIEPELKNYLKSNAEDYVLNCMSVTA